MSEISIQIYESGTNYPQEKVRTSKGESLLRILSQTSEDDDTVRPAVIGKALDILISVHESLVVPDDQSVSHQALEVDDDSPMEDARRRRMLHALLDLISLEGIYPSLSSGVSIPLQQRVISVLPAGVIAKQASVVASSVPHNQPLLRSIIYVLIDLLSDPRRSIQPVIRGRILSDIISGTVDLAFNPDLTESSDRSIYQKALVKLVAEYVPNRLPNSRE
jgi:hypothetical protein